MDIREICKNILPVDKAAAAESQRRWNSIAKPLHSLGKLEDAIIKIAGITGDPVMHLEKKGLITMCADNGIVEEEVTQTGQEVTAIVTDNFLTGAATASVMCQKAGADIFPVDIGVAADTNAISKKIAYGTKNFVKEPAMTREQAEKAILVGIQMVEDLKTRGYGILATGEMGIGNTTTSSAAASVLLKKPVEEVTGYGAGLSSEGLNRKINAIKKGIALHKPDPEDAVDVLAKVGGFDLAGIAGVFIGGALFRVPILIDGFISAVGALCAVKICPEVKDFMLATHVSKEPAARMIMDALGLDAPLHCDMCLGEGTGAVAFFPILDLANEVYSKMSTFNDINVEQYEELK
ncbi:MAG: nicotinate-nucleotide--dimethylbenzimidazole phosphoribosyltransferase [Lachnospiraceae bacterium]|nr:nicotinate-nucleotide--dimethylbenzimidazole phosphoribosyltransferase [Lachnospiraceae bacterium]